MAHEVEFAELKSERCDTDIGSRGVGRDDAALACARETDRAAAAAAGDPTTSDPTTSDRGVDWLFVLLHCVGLLCGVWAFVIHTWLALRGQASLYVVTCLLGYAAVLPALLMFHALDTWCLVYIRRRMLAHDFYVRITRTELLSRPAVACMVLVAGVLVLVMAVGWSWHTLALALAQVALVVGHDRAVLRWMTLTLDNLEISKSMGTVAVAARVERLGVIDTPCMDDLLSLLVRDTGTAATDVPGEPMIWRSMLDVIDNLESEGGEALSGRRSWTLCGIAFVVQCLQGSGDLIDRAFHRTLSRLIFVLSIAVALPAALMSIPIQWAAGVCGTMTCPSVIQFADSLPTQNIFLVSSDGCNVPPLASNSSGGGDFSAVFSGVSGKGVGIMSCVFLVAYAGVVLCVHRLRVPRGRIQSTPAASVPLLHQRHSTGAAQARIPLNSKPASLKFVSTAWGVLSSIAGFFVVTTTLFSVQYSYGDICWSDSSEVESAALSFQVFLMAVLAGPGYFLTVFVWASHAILEQAYETAARTRLQLELAEKGIVVVGTGDGGVSLRSFSVSRTLGVLVSLCLPLIFALATAPSIPGVMYLVVTFQACHLVLATRASETAVAVLPLDFVLSSMLEEGDTGAACMRLRTATLMDWSEVQRAVVVSVRHRKPSDFWDVTSWPALAASQFIVGKKLRGFERDNFARLGYVHSMDLDMRRVTRILLFVRVAEIVFGALRTLPIVSNFRVDYVNTPNGGCSPPTVADCEVSDVPSAWAGWYTYALIRAPFEFFWLWLQTDVEYLQRGLFHKVWRMFTRACCDNTSNAAKNIRCSVALESDVIDARRIGAVENNALMASSSRVSSAELVKRDELGHMGILDCVQLGLGCAIMDFCMGGIFAVHSEMTCHSCDEEYFVWLIASGLGCLAAIVQQRFGQRSVAWFFSGSMGLALPYAISGRCGCGYMSLFIIGSNCAAIGAMLTTLVQISRCSVQGVVDRSVIRHLSARISVVYTIIGVGDLLIAPSLFSIFWSVRLGHLAESWSVIFVTAGFIGCGIIIIVATAPRQGKQDVGSSILLPFREALSRPAFRSLLVATVSGAILSSTNDFVLGQLQKIVFENSYDNPGYGGAVTFFQLWLPLFRCLIMLAFGNMFGRVSSKKLVALGVCTYACGLGLLYAGYSATALIMAGLCFGIGDSIYFVILPIVAQLCAITAYEHGRISFFAIYSMFSLLAANCWGDFVLTDLASQVGIASNGTGLPLVVVIVLIVAPLCTSVVLWWSANRASNGIV
jgi:hypothetical protein